MNYQSFVAPIRVLMGPGPSEVPQRVLEAMARPTIGHLDPAFVGLMDEIKALLQYAFQTENQLTIPISGPGTAGMETCFANLVEPGDTVVVCQNGAFGGRMQQMIERCGGTAVMVQTDWGRAIDPERVDVALGEHPNAKALAFVQAETSTGVLSDAQTLCALAQQHNCLSIVDAVTSLAGSPLYVDRWGVDAIYSGTQKCLSCPPGLSPISLSDRAAATIKNRTHPVQSWFMDLNLIMGYWGSTGQRAYHHTAPINALYGLHEGLLMLKEEGIEQAWARHTHHHQQLVAGLEHLGIEMLVPQNERLPQLNAVRIPEGAEDAQIRRQLLDEFGLEIGAGLGVLAGQIWRIGLMGYGCSERNVNHCLGALRNLLTEQGLLPTSEGVQSVAGPV